MCNTNSHVYNGIAGMFVSVHEGLYGILSDCLLLCKI